MFNLFFSTLIFTSVAVAQVNEPDVVILPTIDLKKAPDTKASEDKTTVTSSDLQLRQSQTLADALRSVEGVTVVNSGGPGKPSSVFIRGANADHVLVLIDGVEINDLLSPSRAASLDQVFQDEVERIEILRGPQTLRYGPSALNGVINIITKKGLGSPKRLVKAEIGKYSTVDGMIGVSGGEPDTNYDIRYSQFQTSGFSSADENLPGNTEPDRASQTQVSGRFGTAPFKNLDLDLSVRYVDSYNANDLGGGANQDDLDFFTRTRKLLTSLQSKSSFQDGFIDLHNLVALQRFDRVSQNNPDLTNPASLYENYHGQLLKASSNTNLNWTRNQSTSLGIDFKEDRGRSNQFSEKYNQLLGAYASHSYSSNSGIFFDVGARWDEALVDSQNYFTTQNGIGYAFSDQTNFRVGGGTSIKQPSLYQLYSTFGNRNLKTERASGVDAKLEHNFADNVGKLSSSIFYNHFDDLIDISGLQYANFGSAETYGAEFLGRTPIASGILIGGTYTLLRTHSLQSGLPLLRRPNESATADLQLNVTDNFQILHSTNFVGVRDDVDAVGTRTTLPKHFVSRLVTNYQVSKDSKISVRIENLYDRKYEEIAGFGTSRRAAYVDFSSQF